MMALADKEGVVRKIRFSEEKLVSILREAASMSPPAAGSARPKARFGACLWRQGGGLRPSVSRVTPL